MAQPHEIRRPQLLGIWLERRRRRFVLMNQLAKKLNRMFPSRKALLQEAGIEVRPADQAEEVNKKVMKTILYQDHNFE
ncbi:hypothetical protein ANCDUO_13736 [Ancylostoma duodenale]|uniref:Uncharacterized protein n=1 Tax=Ancylostoma duodenale TaxID=51022 RepID=A0A0C2GG49_9BILA|nr:hypothetical protein ANCDUO_13736 [Ancylostoma duodenale]